MAAKASKKKAAKDAPKQDKPKKKAAVATAPENRAHHATLSETQCSDCAVGLLRQFASESLRKQKKVDPGNQKFHLQDDEELELLRTNPLTLQLVGLRRERSLSNRFDDLLVVLYDPALLKEGEKTVLDAEGLRAENLKDAQAYVDAVLLEKDWAPPKNWPLPGVDVSCPVCKHWRVLVFPITTEPGYDKDKPSLKDAEGSKLPDFDNVTLLPNDVGAIAPGIYNGYYRVGLHKGSLNPPTSYAALQFIGGTIPARRRYPVSDFLNAAQAAYEARTDAAICAPFAEKDAEAQKTLREKFEEELGKTMPRKTSKEKVAFNKAVASKLTAHRIETYAAEIAEVRKQQARAALDLLVSGNPKVKPKINATERFIRLEDASGAETQDFEVEGNAVSHLEVMEDDASPMKWGLQLAFKPPPLPPALSPPSATAPTTAAPTTAPAAPPPAEVPPTPPPPRTLRLTANEVIVTFGTASGTNIHRSVDGERGSWRRGREVNDFSEGCQVFRSPQDFRDLLRLAMLSKRAQCPSRQASCCAELTVADVEKGIGSMMSTFLLKLPTAFAEEARDAVTKAFAPPPPLEPAESTPATDDAALSPATSTDAATPSAPDPKAVTPQPAPDPKLVETATKLLDESVTQDDFDKQVRGVFQKVFPNPSYDSASNFELLKSFTRQKMIEALLFEENVKTAAGGGAPQPTREKKAFEKALEKTLKGALDKGLEELRMKLTEVRDAWVQDEHTRHIKRRRDAFFKDRLEPCDFGTCGFTFDYMLAETTRANMESFVAKLGERDWNTLFPEDAPPLAPKPAKKPPSKSASNKGKSPKVAAGSPGR
ncbi:hypothetical protein [Myxococcus sp. RHSTA-1-4]|uniref:hypothetical protein n=1 Tax=Myxococcus sp. RHSTA-1-4 TaxID=2874601 RepID=UPI001CBA738D|nr:hypothetical protein [Myxococcus sp. RHSTA-1-4]MBZ4419190.1 hypothetical protein [Myxococcus sp. RHSTA-1-4]